MNRGHECTLWRWGGILFLLLSVAVIHSTDFFRHGKVSQSVTQTVLPGGSNPKLVKAYVISINDMRWEYTAALLRHCGLRPIRAWPVPLNSSVLSLTAATYPADVMARLKKTLSNKLTQIRIWREIGADRELAPNEFSLIFEDDVELNHDLLPTDVPAIVNEAGNLANYVGVFLSWHLWADLSRCCCSGKRSRSPGAVCRPLCACLWGA